MERCPIKLLQQTRQLMGAARWWQPAPQAMPRANMPIRHPMSSLQKRRLFRPEYAAVSGRAAMPPRQLRLPAVLQQRAHLKWTFPEERRLHMPAGSTQQPTDGSRAQMQYPAASGVPPGEDDRFTDMQHSTMSHDIILACMWRPF